MKLLKNIFLIFWLLILSFILISCGDNSSLQNQNEIQQVQNIYFNYPIRDYPIGRSESSQLYWDCSENDFCSNYNGKFHSGEDWNLKGGSTGEIDEGKQVYSIGEGKVIYAEKEKDGSGNDIGFRVVIEHTGNCAIPAKENIGGSSISYGEEVVDKIYSVYLHLKDAQVNVGDKVNINTVIGFITKAGTGPHLHFEIKKEGKIIYDSYFGNIQQIIDLGFRDPSEFIEANMLESKVIKGSSQTIPEESLATETNIDGIKEEENKTSKIDNYNRKLTEYLIYRSEVEKLLQQLYNLKYGIFLNGDFNLDDLDESNYKEAIEFFKLNSSTLDSFIDDYNTIKIPDFANDGSKYYLDFLNNGKLICDQWIIIIENIYIEKSEINFDEITKIDGLYENDSVLQNKCYEEFNKIEQDFNEEAEVLGLTKPFVEK